MFPRRSFLAVLLACLAPLATTTMAQAEATRDTPRMVRVTLRPGMAVQRLVDAGLDVTPAKGEQATVLTPLQDEAKLTALGASFELVDPTPGQTLAARSRAELAARPPAAGTRVHTRNPVTGAEQVQVLPPFGSGSLAGFWTRDEVNLHLPDLGANDPNSVGADTIDTLG